MAIYYVKSGGTATGDAGRETTQRTGAFEAAANNYDSILDVTSGVPTTAPLTGDEIRCSDLHNKVHTGILPAGIVDGSFIIISVDNANQENYKIGAQEGTSSTSFAKLMTSSVTGLQARFYGMIFKYGAEMTPLGATEHRISYFDCTFEITGTGSSKYLALDADGGVAIFDNCTFTFGHNTQNLRLSNGTIVDIRGGSVTTAQLILIDNNGSGGGNAFIKNFDASAMASSSDLISISASSDDNCYARIERVKLPTGGVICSSTSVLPGLNVIGNSIKVGTGGGDNYYQEVFGAGGNTADTAIYRTAGSTFKDGTNYSSDMTSLAACSYYRPLRHEVISFPVDTDDFTTTITFKLHYARDGSTTAYNDDEFWFDVTVNDGADDGLGATKTTKINPFVTGTAPTTETTLWTGLGGSNKQMSDTIIFTIGSSAGNIQTGTVTVHAYFAVASDTVFVDKDVVLS